MKIALVAVLLCVNYLLAENEVSDNSAEVIRSAETKIEEAKKAIIAAEKEIEATKKAKNTEAYLGVYAINLSAPLKSQLNLDKGVMIEKVVKDSPAANAGLSEYDIVLALDSIPVKLDDSLANLLKKYKPGQKLSVEILRANQAKTVDVTLGESVPRLSVEEMKSKMLINPQDMEVYLENPRVQEEAELNKIRQKMRDLHKYKINGIDRELQEMLELFAREPQGPTNFKLSGTNSVVSMNDGEHQIQLNSHNGQRVVTIKDAQGQLIYEGPLNSDEDMAKVPEKVRGKTKRLTTDFKIINE